MAYDQDSQLKLDYSSLVDLIEKTSLRYGDKPAYACLGKTSSFNEIERDSRYFAAYLQNKTTLKPGDRMMCSGVKMGVAFPCITVLRPFTVIMNSLA